MQTQTLDDPELALRQRLKTRLMGGDLTTTLGGATNSAPVPAAPFASAPAAAGPDQRPTPGGWRPTPPAEPSLGADPTRLPPAPTRLPQVGAGGYTPPDPPPYLTPGPTPATVGTGTGTIAPALPNGVYTSAAATGDPTLTPGPAPGNRGITDPTARDRGATTNVANYDLTNQRATQDAWLNFVGQQPYATGPSARGAGFHAGGNAYRGKLQDVVNAFNAAHGTNAHAVGDDKIDFGDGRGAIDVITGGGDWWFGGASGGASGGGGTGGGGTGGGAGAGGGAAASSTPDWYNQIRAMLMGRITAAQAPVNESDNYIAQPLSAARDALTRGQDEERKALAERLYATGDLSSSTLPQQIMQSSERNNVGYSQLRAGLISKEYSARREELANYLQLAMASGDAEMARNIQMEIARLNAAVQRESLGISLAEFLAQLNQNTARAGGGG